MNPEVNFQVAMTAIALLVGVGVRRRAHAGAARREDHAHRSDARGVGAPMIIDVEKWREIFNTLSRHKLRTALTAFGVFWGIFMLTVLLGSGKGFENGVNDGFPRVSNFIFIWGQGKTQIPYQGMPIGRDIAFTPADVDAIAKNVASVGHHQGTELRRGVGRQPAVHRAQVEERRVQRAGRLPGHRGHRSASSIVEGRSINALDEQQRRKVALIGKRVQGPVVRQGRERDRR